MRKSFIIASLLVAGLTLSCGGGGGSSGDADDADDADDNDSGGTSSGVTIENPGDLPSVDLSEYLAVGESASLNQALQGLMAQTTDEDADQFSRPYCEMKQCVLHQLWMGTELQFKQCEMGAHYEIFCTARNASGECTSSNYDFGDGDWNYYRWSSAAGGAVDEYEEAMRLKKDGDTFTIQTCRGGELEMEVIYTTDDSVSPPQITGTITHVFRDYFNPESDSTFSDRFHVEANCEPDSFASNADCTFTVNSDSIFDSAGADFGGSGYGTINFGMQGAGAPLSALKTQSTTSSLPLYDLLANFNSGQIDGGVSIKGRWEAGGAGAAWVVAEGGRYPAIPADELSPWERQSCPASATGYCPMSPEQFDAIDPETEEPCYLIPASADGYCTDSGFNDTACFNVSAGSFSDSTGAELACTDLSVTDIVSYLEGIDYPERDVSITFTEAWDCTAPADNPVVALDELDVDESLFDEDEFSDPFEECFQIFERYYTAEMEDPCAVQDAFKESEFVGGCEAEDSDGDGVNECDDNCPFDENPDQADSDEDFIGDACSGADADWDDDGIPDFDEAGPVDNCPFDPNEDQADEDGDGIGDACTYDYDDGWCAEDEDSDGVGNCEDWCFGADDSVDADDDGVPDGCDCEPDDATIPMEEPCLNFDSLEEPDFFDEEEF